MNSHEERPKGIRKLELTGGNPNDSYPEQPYCPTGPVVSGFFLKRKKIDTVTSRTRWKDLGGPAKMPRFDAEKGSIGGKKATLYSGQTRSFGKGGGQKECKDRGRGENPFKFGGKSKGRAKSLDLCMVKDPRT